MTLMLSGFKVLLIDKMLHILKHVWNVGLMCSVCQTYRCSVNVIFFLIQSLCSSLLQILCNECIPKSILLSFLNISGSCASACCCTSCFLFRILWEQYLNRPSGENYIILTNSYCVLWTECCNSSVLLTVCRKTTKFSICVSPTRKRRQKY